MLAFRILAQVALAVTSATAAVVNSRATVCNGHAELCSRSFGNVTFVGAHDSYAVGVASNLAVNQDYDVTQQLADGIRMLQLQVHNQNNVLTLCHSTCALLNGGTLESYLGKVKTWLDANPNDVLSILIVNIDNQPPALFGTVFKAAGLDTVSYSPPTSSPVLVKDWPTLGAMIDSGTRLVTFLDNAADFSSVPYLIDEFTNMWEDAFDVTEPSFPCTVNRTKGDTSTQLYVTNHFLDTFALGFMVPDVAKANLTNAATGTGSLGAGVATCAALYSRPPNFMLVDFYEYGGGSVFQVAADSNGVTYAPTSAVPTPKSTTTSSTSASTTATKNGTSAVSFELRGRHCIQLLAVFSGIFLGAVYTL